MFKSGPCVGMSSLLIYGPGSCMNRISILWLLKNWMYRDMFFLNELFALMLAKLILLLLFNVLFIVCGNEDILLFKWGVELE